ncbi:flagellar biosynthetic protein FliQ [Coprothermobacteraceae bacterium]|nr:flagellar biosynthetic protein FliQ [Coprothermobacteraceae bacterium]
MSDFVFVWFRNAVMQVILLVGPVLIVALVLGIIISLIQVLTQIHDPSVAFVPKFLAVMTIILLFGGVILNTLVRFLVSIVSAWSQIP